ncbi:MAG TPA: hypothetical protein PK156_41825 [Polyangium sp.]|nr:hypothetical protein [Polyangium sp.]
MFRSWTPVEMSIAFAIGGSVLAVFVPAFFRNLHASKLSEPVEYLDKLVSNAVAYGNSKPHDISFPPSAPLTPTEVPRGIRVTDPPEIWEHLTWRTLDFRVDEPHAFSFSFESETDQGTRAMRFVATAHGDLDGDGKLSTFQVRGERLPGQPARVLPGMYVDREVE